MQLRSQPGELFQWQPLDWHVSFYSSLIWILAKTEFDSCKRVVVVSACSRLQIKVSVLDQCKLVVAKWAWLLAGSILLTWHQMIMAPAVSWALCSLSGFCLPSLYACLFESNRSDMWLHLGNDWKFLPWWSLLSVIQPFYLSNVTYQPFCKRGYSLDHHFTSLGLAKWGSLHLDKYYTFSTMLVYIYTCKWILFSTYMLAPYLKVDIWLDPAKLERGLPNCSGLGPKFNIGLFKTIVMSWVWTRVLELSCPTSPRIYSEWQSIVLFFYWFLTFLMYVNKYF